MNKELHLILLWQNARYKQQEILDDIQKELKISECIEIEWNDKNVSSNFTRFYGVKLPNRSFKEKECGRGKFLLVTVWDENPKYEYAETSRGFEYVNTNIFRLKDRYRSWTRGGHKVHSTNTVSETNHDITLLLGKNYEDYIKDAPLEWNGQIRTINRDLTGCNGWKNIEELFYTLNATINYVVLRGIDDVNNFVIDENHNDIDILTDDYNNLVYIVNGVPLINKYRPHYLTQIENERIYIDIWNTKNSYYDANWQKNMLKKRQMTKGFFALNDENAFFEMIYHCLMHKRKVADIYYDKAEQLYNKLELNKQYNLSDYKYPFDLYFQILNNFMKQKNYSYIKSKDLSVYYNEKYTKYEFIIDWLKANYNMTNIEPYMLGVFNTDSGYQFLTGEFKEKKLFIKWGGMSNAVLNEYKMGKALFGNNQENFIEPILFNFNNGNNFIATEYTEGVMLSDIIQKNQITEIQKQSYIQQLEQIAQSLIETGIIHRDIRPDNIMVTSDGTLKLIDLQFALYLQKFKINRAFIKTFFALKDLGGKYKVGFYCWDDMFSINKIISELGGKSDKIKNSVEKHRIDLYLVRWFFYLLRTLKFIYKKILCKK